MHTTNIPVSLYVHIPWCLKKCPYCDFNSFTYPNNAYPFNEYLMQLKRDFLLQQDLLQNRPLISIFFGGGTPSLAPPTFYAEFIAFLKENHPLSQDIEITMELNPGTAEYYKIADYYQAGINRISIGAQSFNDKHLQRLGRVHNHENIYTAINEVKAFNFNLDIMHALPDQSLTEALDDLQLAIATNSPHISWYQLTIEPNTYFYKHTPTLPHENVAFDIMQTGLALLANAGYNRYEISAFGKNYYCRHNINYWEFGDYLGIGAGSASKISTYENDALKVIRFNKVKLPNNYLKAENFANKITTLNKQELKFEFMLNACRLISGFSIELLEQRTNLTYNEVELELNIALTKGLINIQNGIIVPTELGMMFNNELQGIFLP